MTTAAAVLVVAAAAVLVVAVAAVLVVAVAAVAVLAAAAGRPSSGDVHPTSLDRQLAVSGRWPEARITLALF